MPAATRDHLRELHNNAKATPNPQLHNNAKATLNPQFPHSFLTSEQRGNQRQQEVSDAGGSWLAAQLPTSKRQQNSN